MPTHYEILGIARGAKTDEIVAAYRTVIMQVLPKHSLYPTSVRAFDQFRRVQDAYECLIKPESREKYDAMLQELDAEERSLFGERKARRQVQEQEKQKAQKNPPPFVWNEDTNAPLFWTPGRKLIEGPKPEEETRPVAYYRRTSLDKALILASAESSSDSSKSTVPTSKQLTNSRHSTQSAPAAVPAALPTPKPAPTPFYTMPSAKPLPSSLTTLVPLAPNGALIPGQTKRRFSQPQPVPFISAVDSTQLQKAQMQAMEDRHRRKVEAERIKAMHELEKRRKAVEKEQRRKMQIEEEARRMVEKERENRIIEAEKLRHKQEKENLKREKEKKQPKQVRWAVTDAVFDPVPEYHAIETGPYYDGWFSEPELPKTRPKVLRKRRPVA